MNNNKRFHIKNEIQVLRNDLFHRYDYCSMFNKDQQWIMNPIRSRHIVISLIVAFILFILVKANQDNNPVKNSGAHTLLQSQYSFRSFDSDQSFSSYSFQTQTQSNLNRHEILKKKMKGYREITYWGSEHPTQERTRYLNDDEFNRFLREEIEEKNADVYWGAEY